MLIVFHQVGGDRCRAPGQGPPQWSSMRLIGTGKKRKPGCSALSDPEGEVSAPDSLVNTSFMILTVPPSDMSARTRPGVFPRAERRVLVGMCCGAGEEECSVLRAEPTDLLLDPASPELSLDTGFISTGLTLPCHSLCFVLSESCALYPLPVRRVKTVFTTPEAKCLQRRGSDGGWVCPLGFFRPESKNIPAVFCAQTRRSDNHYVSSCLHMQICV